MRSLTLVVFFLFTYRISCIPLLLFREFLFQNAFLIFRCVKIFINCIDRVKKKPVEYLENLRPGDCIVCFNKEEIYRYKIKLAQQGIEVMSLMFLLTGTTLTVTYVTNTSNTQIKFKSN